MYKKQRIRLVLLCIILAISLIVLINYIQRETLTAEEKKIYNIYKSIDGKEVINKESLTDAPTVSIMSYNIKDGKDKDGKNTVSKIKRLIEETNIDIVCLQEVRDSQNRLLRPSNTNKTQYVSGVSSQVTPTGLSTYSKYPLIESNHILLPSKGEQRGALHTVYKVKGERLNVINVHLGLDRKERVQQVKTILRYANKLSGEVIIAGDFNQAPLAMKGYRDIGKYHGYDNKSTFMPIDVRIDYIFMTTDNIYSATYNHIDIELSDHYPIIAKIKYKPKELISSKTDEELESNNIVRGDKP